MKRKTSRSIILAACLILLAEQAFFLISGFCLPQQYGDTFMGELKTKCTRLEEIREPKIVLVGGSGVAFGYDCRLIEQTLKDYRAVNFGMYAGLGTKVMLDLSEDRIQEGDLVIISPEQDAQTLSDYFNAEYMWQAADGAFHLLTDLKKENLEQMVGEFPHFALQKLGYVLEGKRPKADGVYRKDSFNEYGDIETEVCAENKMPMGYDSNHSVSFDQNILQEDFVQYLNAYAAKMKKKGATVWYRFSPVNRLSVEDPEDLISYYEMMREKLNFPIIGNPKNSIMDAEWFFDTNFHLNADGKTINTVQFIRDVKAMLGDSSSVEIMLPQKTEKTWMKTEEEIWDTQACAGNTDIEKVTIPEKVTLIEDYSFDGCTNLKKIVMEQEDPAECLVGQHLLDGTDADIYVPMEALSRYKLNYSWSVYAERLYGYTDK